MTLVNFNATTPQLALVKNFMNAYLTLDVKKISPFISKNFTFQTFPKTPDLPDQAKGEHFEGYETLLSMISKAEVCVQPPRERLYITRFPDSLMPNHPQVIVHEVIEAPGKVVLHVCPPPLQTATSSQRVITRNYYPGVERELYRRWQQAGL